MSRQRLWLSKFRALLKPVRPEGAACRGVAPSKEILVGQSSVVNEVVSERISAYVRRATVLRQIHSNKGSRARRFSRFHLVVTVLVASVVSVIGFMGADRLAALISTWVTLSPRAVDAAYSVSALAILVLTILGLIYRFDERGDRHYRSIEVLTEFIRDVDDAVALSRAGAQLLSPLDLERVRLRYEGILSSLPPNTDKEYLKAKRSAAEKRAAKKEIARASSTLWDDDGGAKTVESALGARLAGILRESSRGAVLTAVRDSLGSAAWITGGFVREAVWDAVHEYSIPTSLDDVDVIYFDAQNCEKAAEREMEASLRRFSANVDWSVKNQARMHLVNGDAPYRSVEDAVSRFPETATAVACRLGFDGRIKILAPYGLSDLFGLIIRPTPGFPMVRYRQRLAKKNWHAKWPELHLANHITASRKGRT